MAVVAIKFLQLFHHRLEGVLDARTDHFLYCCLLGWLVLGGLLSPGARRSWGLKGLAGLLLGGGFRSLRGSCFIQVLAEGHAATASRRLGGAALGS